MHSSAISKLFNCAGTNEGTPIAPGISQPDGLDDPMDQPGLRTPPVSLLALAKSESLRSAQRRQLASVALAGFPVWDLALFLFENQYENRRVTLAEISQEIEWSETATVRHLLLLEAEGAIRLRNNKGELDMSVTLSAKTHEAIADYLRHDR